MTHHTDPVAAMREACARKRPTPARDGEGGAAKGNNEGGGNG